MSYQALNKRLQSQHFTPAFLKKEAGVFHEEQSWDEHKANTRKIGGSVFTKLFAPMSSEY